MIDNEFWPGCRVMVTGGGGFLGRAVVRRLEVGGADSVFVPRSRGNDVGAQGRRGLASADGSPDFLIQPLAVVTGPGAKRANPGRCSYENAIMGTQLMEQIRPAAVAKIVTIRTSCAFWMLTIVPNRCDDRVAPLTGFAGGNRWEAAKRSRRLPRALNTAPARQRSGRAAWMPLTGGFRRTFVPTESRSRHRHAAFDAQG